MRTTPARSDSESPSHDGRDVPDTGPATARPELYELWQTDELRRHVAILEAELARAGQSQAELEELRSWKAQVERSRSWRIASSLSRIRRLPNRIGRSISNP